MGSLSFLPQSELEDRGYKKALVTTWCAETQSPGYLGTRVPGSENCPEAGGIFLPRACLWAELGIPKQ
eukprot:299749-Rhodomonas_salina.2